MPTNRPLRVFLCHASEDKPAVRKLYNLIKSKPWIAPWLDEESLVGGQDFDLEIYRATREADAIIVCLSKISVAKSGYVNKEIRRVLDVADEKTEGEIYIIPLRLDDCVPSFERLKTLHWIDYFAANGHKQLLKSLQTRAKEVKINVFERKNRIQKLSSSIDLTQSLKVVSERYVQQILSEQGPSGDWSNSVSLTSMAIIILLKASYSPFLYPAIQHGVNWLCMVQDSEGSWGSYRGRTIEERLTGIRYFDPDLPHTIYALWATLLVNSDKQPNFDMAAKWIQLHFREERRYDPFWMDVDLLMLGHLAKRRKINSIANLPNVFRISKRKMQKKITELPPFAPNYLRTLYRYTKYTGFGDALNLESRRELAKEVNRRLKCLDYSTYQGDYFYSNINAKTCALEILLCLDPEYYRTKVGELLSLLENEVIHRDDGDILSRLNVCSAILEFINT